MGKRKRSALVYHSSPSDSMPCSSGRDLTPGELHTAPSSSSFRTSSTSSRSSSRGPAPAQKLSKKSIQISSDPDESSIFESHPSRKEIMDNRGKQPHSQLSLGQHHHHNLSRSMFLKCSRQHYGNQYSRRNSSNNHKPSTYGRGGAVHDERLCFKMGSKNNSDMGHRSDFTEFREKASMRPERITPSSLVIHAVSPEGVRVACALCQQPLRRKPLSLERIMLASESEELSVVAVLVCGHKFHANCLEYRTCLEDKRDPPCPVCKVQN